jgi:hypothetical protein
MEFGLGVSLARRRAPREGGERAGDAFADGPAALLTLKPGSGTDHPAFAGLSARASSAPHSTSGRRDSLKGSRTAYYPVSAVAPATDAHRESPAKAGRSVPGPDFSDRGPACGPSAGAQSALSHRRLTPYSELQAEGGGAHQGGRSMAMASSMRCCSTRWSASRVAPLGAPAVSASSAGAWTA